MTGYRLMEAHLVRDLHTLHVARFILAVTIAMVTERCASGSDRPTLSVMFHNQSKVAGETLHSALSQAGHLFAKADVRIEWKKACDPRSRLSPDVLVLRVVDTPPLSFNRPDLGFALLTPDSRPFWRPFITTAWTDWPAIIFAARLSWDT